MIDKKEQPTVAYICKARGKGAICPSNGQPCAYQLCRHTRDIKYAKNFVEVDYRRYDELDRSWIPCSLDIKPKKYVNVLFCDIDGDIYKGYLTDKDRWYDYSCDDPIKNVIAWMFLPEPYKKEGEIE